MARTEREKMLAGELHDPADANLQAELDATHRWLARYNAALAKSTSERRTLFMERLAVVGEGAVIRPPFHCDCGLSISLGAGAFLNFNCVILDVVGVAIGDRSQIGPAVQALRPSIRAIQPVAGPVGSPAGPSASAATSGSEAGPSSCQA